MSSATVARSAARVATTATPEGRVLVVDDLPHVREAIAANLQAVGYAVVALPSAIAALARLEHESFDVVLTDLQMPGMDGLEFIRRIQKRQFGVQVVVITAYADVDSAVEAMRHGAFDYVKKPFTADQLEQLVAAAMAHGRRLDQASSIDRAKPGAPVLIGSSPAMQALRRRIAQVAPTPEPVLITGESGTGKEVVARCIHAQSNRASAPFIQLNCAALPEQLAESELFGHREGAFTGAATARTGYFEVANTGTIQLDEISETPLALQAKLLRVLQEQAFQRVGSSETIRVDVRVLATCNRDLPTEVREGRFREDLYFRLNVLPMVVPPLRERREDIPELLDYFLEQSAARLGKPKCELTPSALDLLQSYHWPGNVRELQNIVRGATVLNQGQPIGPDDLKPWLMGTPGREEAPTLNVAAGVSLRQMERQLIEATLKAFGGHREKTAKALGIGLRTLTGKLKDYGYTSCRSAS